MHILKITNQRTLIEGTTCEVETTNDRVYIFLQLKDYINIIGITYINRIGITQVHKMAFRRNNRV